MAIKEEQGTPNRPGRKGYVTTTFTGPDVKKARGLLDRQARDLRQKIGDERAKWHTRVRNFRDKVRLVSEKKAASIRSIQRALPQLYPKGPRAERSLTVMMPAYIKNGRVVHEGDPDY